ncbi:MAG: GHMP kinase [Spirochaetes bacterium]|nr:GHMP kinase [Spirochaetota bacterium]
MKLFVPGRICLFGEHSDWAGGYRRINSEIERGYTIITGTNQGIYAEIKQHPSKLILRTTLNDGTKKGPFEIEMNPNLLLQEAQKGGFFSYVCGVAYQILINYHVRGLEIDNFKTDLPIKKGLSSSAAVCVLAARAFNRTYDLKMTTRGEMEYAYQGEITTPSRCGRMDQGCAYGSRPVLMVFDADRIETSEIRVPKDIFLVIVDLNARKDTKRILARLNKCYPFADDPVQENVQRYLGPTNKKMVQKAVETLQKGDETALGSLMSETQWMFDEFVAPACPDQLEAPLLHKVLGYKALEEHVIGGKGVGSQGDGSAQLVVKDEASQEAVMEILKNELSMQCLPLVLRSARKIKKCVIPAAGFSTRLFPASKAMKKELFPIIDKYGRAKPVILAIVEEALSAGIEELAIIVQERDKPLFEGFFHTLPFSENFNKLSKDDQKYCRYLMDIGSRVSFVMQDVQEGFGHAVYCAREWTQNEPFLLMLGDHLYRSDTEATCTRQLIDAYERYGTNLVGLKVIRREEVDRYGCVGGIWEKPGSVLSITEFSEKPTPEYAKEHLGIDGIKEEGYLAMFGQYILKPRVFDLLAELMESNMRERGEFQLTSALDLLRREESFYGYLVKGSSYDMGTPGNYRQTIVDYGGE